MTICQWEVWWLPVGLRDKKIPSEDPDFRQLLTGSYWDHRSGSQSSPPPQDCRSTQTGWNGPICWHRFHLACHSTECYYGRRWWCKAQGNQNHQDDQWRTEVLHRTLAPPLGPTQMWSTMVAGSLKGQSTLWKQRWCSLSHPPNTPKVISGSSWGTPKIILSIRMIFSPLGCQ